MLTPQQIKEIEEKFDERFIHFSDFGHYFTDDIKPSGECEIKSFIITTINNILAETEKEINRKMELFACKVDARRLGANGFEIRNLNIK